MALSCVGEQRTLTLSVTGEVDHHSAKEIMKETDRLMEERLPKTVTVDLSGVTFMDSSGIAVLLRIYKRVSALGGTVTVSGAPAQALRVLKTAGLHKLLSFTE